MKAKQEARIIFRTIRRTNRNSLSQRISEGFVRHQIHPDAVFIAAKDVLRYNVYGVLILSSDAEEPDGTHGLIINLDVLYSRDYEAGSINCTECDSFI